MFPNIQTYDTSDFKEIGFKFTSNSKYDQKMYYKQHNVREMCALKPSNRTLFIINVHPLATEESLKNLFKECGPIEAVYLNKKPTAGAPDPTNNEFPSEPIKGFKVAYVVFEETDGLKKALKLKEFSSPLFLSTESFGLQGYYKSLVDSEVNIFELQQDIDKYISEYDRKIKDQKDGNLRDPDEDGWITVKNKRRNPGYSRSDNKFVNRKKEKKLENFYSFQIKEQKLKHMEKIKEKFNEDKKKISLIRESRKFRPF